MANDLPLRCTCGALRGTARSVSASRGNRVICYCDDCQSFAYFLEREDEILDAHGGTDVFQMSPSRLDFDAGQGQLACLRLTPGGLLRWYAACCRTPIGNTPASHQIPFVGLIHSCMDFDALGMSHDDVLGPSRAGVQARFAKGDRARLDAHDKAPLSMILRVVPRVLAARLRGEHAQSPFFDPTTHAPRVTPRVLTTEELGRVESSRDASS